jgi:hypothetical protein
MSCRTFLDAIHDLRLVDVHHVRLAVVAEDLDGALGVVNLREQLVDDLGGPLDRQREVVVIDERSGVALRVPPRNRNAEVSFDLAPRLAS